MDEQVPTQKSSLTRAIPNFESFTKKFLASSLSNQIQCPTCTNVIDFNKSIAWYGPDTFTCGSCNRYLSMKLVERAMRDLGMRSFEIIEM